MTVREWIKASSTLGAGAFTAKKHFTNLEGRVVELFKTKLVPEKSSLESGAVITPLHTCDVDVIFTSADREIPTVEADVTCIYVTADVDITQQTIELNVKD